MGSPVNLSASAPIAVYAGDPKDIIIQITGEDRTDKIFSAQIRSRATDATVLTSFTVSVALVGSDTVITLSLGGDSAPGVDDGQTRTIGRTAVFDVQQINASGVIEQTIAVGKLAITQDVTR